MPLVFLFYSLYVVYKKIKRKKGIKQVKQQLQNRLLDYRQRVPLVLILENDSDTVAIEILFRSRVQRCNLWRRWEAEPPTG